MMEKALEKIKAAAEQHGWDYERVEKDFRLWVEFGEYDVRDYLEAAEEYIEETLNQGYEE